METSTECPAKAYTELLGMREPERITAQVMGSVESSRKFRPISQRLLGSWEVNTGCCRELKWDPQKGGWVVIRVPLWLSGVRQKEAPMPFCPWTQTVPQSPQSKGRELRFIKWLLCARAGYGLQKHHFILNLHYKASIISPIWRWEK